MSKSAGTGGEKTLKNILAGDYFSPLLCSSFGEAEKIPAKIRSAAEAYAARQLAGRLPSGPTAIFGCGRYGRQAAEMFRLAGNEDLIFCDNNSDLWGKTVGGLPVVSPAELRGRNCKIVVAVYSDEGLLSVEGQLAEAGVRGLDLALSLKLRAMLSEVWEPLELLENLAYFQRHWAELQEVFGWLEDERSRQVFLNILKARLYPFDSFHYSLIAKALMDGDQYYALPAFKNIPGLTFVDIGAALGDSVEQCLGHYGDGVSKIYSFEPFPDTFEMLADNVNGLKSRLDLPDDLVECFNMAVGSAIPAENEAAADWPFAMHYGFVFQDDGLIRGRALSSAYFKGDRLVRDGSLPMIPPGEIEIGELDRLFPKGFSKEINFIKMDAEGSELDILHGGRELIKRARPHLAVSLYHKPYDLFSLPLFIKGLVPEYKMAIRHHGPTLWETVLYCWI